MALVGWALGGVRLLSIFVFCALLVAAGAYWTFDRVVLGMIGARELPLGEAPLLHSTVERLAAKAGIAKPRLYLIPDGLPLRPRPGAACAAPPSRRAPAASLRARRPSSRPESRTRSRTCACTSSVQTRGGRRRRPSCSRRQARRCSSARSSSCSARSLRVRPPSRLAEREFAADRLAASLCDSPHGLADASSGWTRLGARRVHGSPATEPLFPINPFAERGLGGALRHPPPVGERVRRLRELDPARREKLRGCRSLRSTKRAARGGSLSRR